MENKIELTAEHFLKSKGYNINSIICKDDSLNNGYMDFIKLMEQYAEEKLSLQRGIIITKVD